MSYFRAIRRGEPPKPSFELLKPQEHCFCEILQDNLADAPLVPRELLVRILHKPRYSGRHELLGGRG